jgi:hypothetical protein
MEYKVEILGGCRPPGRRSAWVGSPKVVYQNAVGRLDSYGLSVLVVGGTTSWSIQASHEVTAVENPCPAGQCGTEQKVDVTVEFVQRISVGFNPGLGPFSFDLGWSVGLKNKVVASDTYTFGVKCCNACNAK